jgi:hypothetical protein
MVDGLLEEGVHFFGEHEVVGNADGDGYWEDDRVDQQGIKWPETPDVQINVYATVMVENEIANGVRPLNRVLISVERAQKPWIMLRDKLARAGIGPKYILTEIIVANNKRGGRDKEGRINVLIRHHIPTSLRHWNPSFGERVGLPRLVNYPWNTLYFSMLGCIPASDVAQIWNFVFGQIGRRINGQIIRDGGEHDDRPKEEDAQKR